jgi:hypothetical protein
LRNLSEYWRGLAVKGKASHTSGLLSDLSEPILELFRCDKRPGFQMPRRQAHRMILADWSSIGASRLFLKTVLDAVQN